MARSTQKRSGIRGFVILTLIVALLGGYLWSQGDLISPVQSTTLLVSVSSGDSGFAMVGERGTLPDASAETTVDTGAVASDSTAIETAAEAAPVAETVAQDTTTTEVTTLTMDEFVAQLAAAGVDVDTVSATMSAEGRSLDNLLAVVNSGRTTVADLATRLSGQTTQLDTGSTESTEETPSAPAEDGGSTSLLDFRWEELGSVAYNLWFMLAITIFVIVLGRPIGWLINRLKRTPAANA